MFVRLWSCEGVELKMGTVLLFFPAAFFRRVLCYVCFPVKQWSLIWS